MKTESHGAPPFFHPFFLQKGRKRILIRPPLASPEENDKFIEQLCTIGAAYQKLFEMGWRRTDASD